MRYTPNKWCNSSISPSNLEGEDAGLKTANHFFFNLRNGGMAMPKDIWKAMCTAFLFLLMICFTNNTFIAIVFTMVFYVVFVRTDD